jgi:hypothetical protein
VRLNIILIHNKAAKTSLLYNPSLRFAHNLRSPPPHSSGHPPHKTVGSEYDKISFVSDKRFGLTDTCLCGLRGNTTLSKEGGASTTTIPNIHGALFVIVVPALKLVENYCR